MGEVARCNGSVLVEDGDTVGIVEQGGGWYGTAVFVLVLIGVMTLLAGIAVAVSANVIGGVALVAVSLVDTAAIVWILKKKRAAASAPLPAPWLVFDRAARVVRDRSGAQLCAFGEVRIERVFQAGSSSKALAVYCPKKLVVARGNPFGDEVDGLEAALKRTVA